jgi:YidC/Oxa1 family membrane protein insertase
MMIFMGFLFFKVPAGLCIYFITSSLWSLAERKLLSNPKPQVADPATPKKSEAKSMIDSIKSFGSKTPTNGAARREERKRMRSKK